MPSLARTCAIQAAAATASTGRTGHLDLTAGPDVITNGQECANATDSSGYDPIRINGYSGRVTALAFGKDPSTIYLGTALGGLWRSTDGANTWKPLLDQQASMAVGGLAVVPGTPDTIYVGTGEGNSSCDSEFGQGLLKSIDGGDNWEQKAAATFDRLTFTRLSVDPVDPKVLYAATNNGVTDSQSSTCFSIGVTTGTSGVYKSTDAGETWDLRSGFGGLAPGGTPANGFQGSAFDVQPNPAPSFSGPFTGTIFDSGGDSCLRGNTPPGQATLTAFNGNETPAIPNPFKIQVAPSAPEGTTSAGTIQIKPDPAAPARFQSIAAPGPTRPAGSATTTAAPKDCPSTSPTTAPATSKISMDRPPTSSTAAAAARWALLPTWY